MRPVLASQDFPADPAPPVRGRLDDEAKRSFLRMISHELRTPLNSIIGFSEVLREELCGPLGTPLYKEYAAYISGSGHKMLKLVNQIVEIVRLESQADPMDRHREAVDQAIGEAFHNLAPSAEAWGVRLVAIDLDDMPAVIADGRGLCTVLKNLLLNALSHSPPGQAVEVRAWRTGAKVTIEISDKGPGLDPEDVPRLMRPFEQGEQTLTRSTDGAGLGLPIALLVTEAMDGALTLHTAPGQGLTARIVLPAA